MNDAPTATTANPHALLRCILDTPAKARLLEPIALYLDEVHQAEEARANAELERAVDTADAAHRSLARTARRLGVLDGIDAGDLAHAGAELLLGLAPETLADRIRDSRGVEGAPDLTDALRAVLDLYTDMGAHAPEVARA